MDLEERKELANKYHAEGFNCAQSVIASFADDFKISKELALRITGAMGGGVRSGEICGAVLGASCVVGLKYGHCSQEDIENKALCAEKSAELISRFKEINNNVCCRDLLGYNINDLNEEQFNIQREKQAVKCGKYISDSVELVYELIK